MSIYNAYMSKKKMMAKGGMMEKEDDDTPDTPAPIAGSYAEGGEVEDDLIRRAMKRCMAEGGEVTGDDKILADFEENQFDVMPKEDDLSFSYTDENSGDDLGNAEKEEDERDVVRRAMRSLAKKDRNPSPA